MDSMEIDEHFAVGLIREGPCMNNRIVYLSSNELVGRGTTTTQTILSKFVSREHFRIYHEPVENFWVVEDLGAMNGTFINDYKLDFKGKCPLRVGDYIGLGVDYQSWRSNPEFYNDEDYYVYKFSYVNDVDFHTLCEQFKSRMEIED